MDNVPKWKKRRSSTQSEDTPERLQSLESTKSKYSQECEFPSLSSSWNTSHQHFTGKQQSEGIEHWHTPSQGLGSRDG